MSDSATRHLRVAHILVQPVLIWDDGQELTPGPAVQSIALSPSQTADFLARLPEEVKLLEAQAINNPESDSPETQGHTDHTSKTQE